MGIAIDQMEMTAAIRDHHKNLEAEKTRRYARYDEAVRLLREVTLYTDNVEMDNKIVAFLASEPAERGEGGAG